MTTSQRIIRMISVRPRTKTFIADQLGVSEKTVRNRLGEIHSEYEIGPERFAVYRTGDRAQALYGIVNMPAPRRKRVQGSGFILNSPVGAIEGGLYNTVVYSPALPVRRS